MAAAPLLLRVTQYTRCCDWLYAAVTPDADYDYYALRYVIAAAALFRRCRRYATRHYFITL